MSQNHLWNQSSTGEKIYSSNSIEWLKNQARDLLIWVLWDPDIAIAWDEYLEILKTREEVMNYMDQLINPKTWEAAINPMSGEMLKKHAALSMCTGINKSRITIINNESGVRIRNITILFIDENITSNDSNTENGKKWISESDLGLIMRTIWWTKQEIANFFITVIWLDKDKKYMTSGYHSKSRKPYVISFNEEGELSLQPEDITEAIPVLMVQ